MRLQGDEDQRRAMMKSFVESNGTVLSTNWGVSGDGLGSQRSFCQNRIGCMPECCELVMCMLTVRSLTSTWLHLPKPERGILIASCRSDLQEVGAKKVHCTPPDGMQVKEWGKE